ASAKDRTAALHRAAARTPIAACLRPPPNPAALVLEPAPALALLPPALQLPARAPHTLPAHAPAPRALQRRRHTKSAPIAPKRIPSPTPPAKEQRASCPDHPRESRVGAIHSGAASPSSTPRSSGANFTGPRSSR